jgi:RNA polymerase sigma-70 factor (ECF subfamily)
MFSTGNVVTERAPTSATVDQADFDQRFALAQPRLMAICRGLVGGDLAADVVHDAYVRGRGRFHQLRDIERFDAWLSRIAVNLCFNWHRHRGDTSDRSAQDLTLSPAVPAHDVGLRELVEQLPPRERTLVVLHYGYGYQIGEIADLLGLSHGSARSVLFRARTKLGEQLREAER